MATVYASIGSNIDRKHNVQASIDALRERYGEVWLSSIYETEAVGFGGDPFYNLIARFESDDSPEQINAYFKDVEAQHGRLHGGEKFAARTLDIDLILYGDLSLHRDSLQLPRDEIEKYAFVLEPLAEIAPEEKYVGRDETYKAMWERFVREGKMVSAPVADWLPV
ncbi:MAG: 2-amino-4-hydroxy-6-hydroxymethyldihydropteridine diphosphokinase [bacterium]